MTITFWLYWIGNGNFPRTIGEYTLTTLHSTETSAPPPARTSKKLLAGMIISTVIAILLISALAFLALVLNLLSAGTLTDNIPFVIIFFGPLLLIIPIIASWVFLARKNFKKALTFTLLSWGFLFLDAVAIALLVLYMFLISSGP